MSCVWKGYVMSMSEAKDTHTCVASGSILAYEYSSWLPSPHHGPAPSSVPQTSFAEQQWRQMAPALACVREAIKGVS